jgi:hypothetical protein
LRFLSMVVQEGEEGRGEEGEATKGFHFTSNLSLCTRLFRWRGTGVPKEGGVEGTSFPSLPLFVRCEGEI